MWIEPGKIPPTGWRSPPVDLARVGIWRPLAAVVAGLILPALLGWALVYIAGVPGFGSGPWLRQYLLLMLTAWAFAPVLGGLALPLLWALALGLLARGFAGLATVVTVTQAVGLAAVHLALHGDLTTEDPTVLPNLAVALAVQATVGWAVFWRLMVGRATGLDAETASNKTQKS